MGTPPVSVLMPCYNAAERLSESIQSIRDQTFTDWELLVVDDGSTDRTLEVARRHAEQDPRVRVIASEHVGIVRALQQASVEARGTFFARMDADDVALPERFERQLALMADHPEVALCGTGVEMTGPGVGEGRLRYQAWLNRMVDHDTIVRELFVECPVAHPAFLMRRADFDEVGGYRDPGWAEDYDLCMRLFLAGKRLGNVPDRLLEWRNSDDRLSMRDARYGLDRFRALKRHYLFRSYLGGNRRFYQWGAGEVGKVWLREWEEAKPELVIDINPRKIGQTIHGVPVVAPEEVPEPEELFGIVAVGAPGARDEIRACYAPLGHEETRDFLFVA